MCGVTPLLCRCSPYLLILRLRRRVDPPLANYLVDGCSEWQLIRAESLRQAAGFGDDKDFPAHVYPTARVRALVERPVAPAMADLVLPIHYLSVCSWRHDRPT